MYQSSLSLSLSLSLPLSPNEERGECSSTLVGRSIDLHTATWPHPARAARFSTTLTEDMTKDMTEDITKDMTKDMTKDKRSKSSIHGNKG